MLWTASHAIRKNESQPQDPYLALLSKNRHRNNDLVRPNDDVDTLSDSASMTCSQASSSVLSTYGERSHGEALHTLEEEGRGEMGPEPRLAKKQTPAKHTSQSRTRSPIRHPTARDSCSNSTSSINASISEPNIIDDPQITENRVQRLSRQERFKWLVSAWSPE